jgi:hypothetical protein
VRPLTAEEDLIDEIRDLVSIKDLEEYNAGLPSQEEIDEYNKQNTQHQNAQNNAHCFQLAIENAGNAQANNIYVDCSFPDGLLAYYDYDIGDIKKPKKLTLPSNPVKEALERLHGHPLGGSPLQAFLKTNAWINAQNASDFARTQVAPININRLRPGYYDRDYSINANRHELTVQVDSLIHSREYLSDKIWFVATQKGKFTVECSVMCAEFDMPREYSFDIEFA